MDEGDFSNANVDLREAFNSLKCVMYRISCIQKNYEPISDVYIMPIGFKNRLQTIMDKLDEALTEFKRIYTNG